MVSLSIEGLDGELAARARAAVAWRLRLGQLLEVLRRLEVFFQLGFSSLGAYALERCERSARWVDGACRVARRLEELPAVRRAVATGQLSWSAAELVAGVACPADEAHWLSLAKQHTFRELRQLVRAARQRSGLERALSSAELGAVAGDAVASDAMASDALALDAVASDAVATGAIAAGAAAELGAAEQGRRALGQAELESEAALDEETCVLTCTVNTEDAWLFEATHTLLDHLGTRGSAAQLEALLAEGQELLLAALPAGALELEREMDGEAARRGWRQQLARWQAEAEARRERELRGSWLRPVLPQLNEVSAGAAEGLSPLLQHGARALDAEVRALSGALVRQELEFGRLLLEFHRVNGWRSLGYATESQYARERLGLSRSCLLARRALARRLEGLPAVAEALGAARIGVEAAQQLARIATRRTEQAWLERAEHRTLKHLREEVSAALSAVRVSGEVDCPPPEAAELEAYGALQQAVISGRACEAPAVQAPARHAARPLVPPESDARRAWLVMLASLERWLAGGLMGSVEPPESEVQMSAARQHAGKGRIVLRWRVSREVFEWWHALRSSAQRWLRPGVSWLRFLCIAFWQAWRHVLGAPVQYGGVYLRDGYQCRSPVCSRRDVTPHHLRFRSQGGGDEPENVASVCSWCHLFGIHGGRIRAEGTAECIHWELGPVNRPCVVVHGRERVAA